MKENKKITDDFIRKENSHIVVKREDLSKYLKHDELNTLLTLLFSVDINKCEKEKKMPNSYYVVNTDEPYAEEVFEIIKKGEIKKQNDKEVLEDDKKPRELQQAIDYFKNRDSFEMPVYDKSQFKTILKYYQIVYENWQECEEQLKSPVADEVAKALGEYYEEEVYYNSLYGDFYISHSNYKCSDLEMIEVFEDLLMDERYDLIKMVAQFYESKVSNDNK